MLPGSLCSSRGAVAGSGWAECRCCDVGVSEELEAQGLSAAQEVRAVYFASGRQRGVDLGERVQEFRASAVVPVPASGAAECTGAANGSEGALLRAGRLHAGLGRVEVFFSQHLVSGFRNA